MRNLLIAIVVACALVGEGRAEEGGGFLEEKPSAFCKVKSSESPLPGKTDIYTGSGCFLSHRIVLTCQHNVRTYRPKRGDKLTVVLHGGREYGKVVILRENEQDDLALLRVNDPALPKHDTLTVTSRVSKPKRVWCVGFDRDEKVVVERAGETGDYPDLGWGGRPSFFQHTARVVQGMSGGPTLNKSGEVAGVSVSSTYQRDGLSQSTNIDRLHEFLD